MAINWKRIFPRDDPGYPGHPKIIIQKENLFRLSLGVDSIQLTHPIESIQIHVFNQLPFLNLKIGRITTSLVSSTKLRRASGYPLYFYQIGPTLLVTVLLFQMAPLLCALRSIMISVLTAIGWSRRLLFVNVDPTLLCSVGIIWFFAPSMSIWTLQHWR